jgi:hypothetical protein
MPGLGSRILSDTCFQCADLAARLPAGGLRRGTTIAVDGSTAVLLALLATATARGS